MTRRIQVKCTIIFSLPRLGVWLKPGLALFIYLINLRIHLTYSRCYTSRKAPSSSSTQIHGNFLPAMFYAIFPMENMQFDFHGNKSSNPPLFS